MDEFDFQRICVENRHKYGEVDELTLHLKLAEIDRAQEKSHNRISAIVAVLAILILGGMITTGIVFDIPLLTFVGVMVPVVFLIITIFTHVFD